MANKNEKNHFKKDVGRRLKDARLRATPRLTQAEAASELGKLMGEEIEPSAIGNYEQGSRLPDPIVVRLLCQLYGASPSAIYGFEDAAINHEEQVLLEKYRLTDDRGKRAIQSIAESQPAYLAPDGKRKLG